MNKNITRADLTLSDLATIYGCCGLFDMCSDADLVSLSLQGADPFLDWLGWLSTKICVVKKEFIAWQRPEYSEGSPTAGHVGDPCGDDEGVEWGKCDFTLENFGRLRRHGPTRDVTMNDVRYCERQPRYRLDGSAITDDREYDARLIAEVQLQDLRRHVITGNALTAGQFDGLQRLVRDGYTNAAGDLCPLMDSIVLDWNSNGLGGGAGITWNDGAIANTWNFIDVLLAILRRLRTRIGWSPTLASQQMQVGNLIIMAPTFLVRCILDSFTCWSVCDGSEFNERVIDTYEARTFRNNLLGGQFGYGRIFLDQFEIPLIGYDWELINGPHCGDVYVLTGAVGAVKTLHGEFLDMHTIPAAYPEGVYAYSDGGRFLRWVERDATCIEQHAEFRPRMLSWAPWAQARIQDVCCDSVFGPLSADPTDTSYFPMDSFTPVECP